MNTLSNHYAMLLGLDEAWLVQDVELSLNEQRVQIHLESTEIRSVPQSAVSGGR